MISIRPARRTELPAIQALLRESGLPVAGVDAHVDEFLVAEEDGGLVGCAAVERYGDAGLLRSVAVRASMRGTGLGQRLTEACIDAARAKGLTTLSLLTETAEKFFPRFGFVAVEQRALPDALKASEELRGACPASARAMILELAPAGR